MTRAEKIELSVLRQNFRAARSGSDPFMQLAAFGVSEASGLSYTSALTRVLQLSGQGGGSGSKAKARPHIQRINSASIHRRRRP